MGLLSRVSGGQSKKTSGLLSRAAPRMQTPSYVSFSDLCRDFGILHGSLFEITDGSFSASACTGLDAQSIALSVSSSDFWNGTIGVDTSIKTFSNPLGNLAAFYQLFSPRIKERLSSVHFFRLSSGIVFMKADFTGENSFPPSETIKIALEGFIKNRGHGGLSKNGNTIFSSTASLPNDKSALFFLLSTKIAINRTLVSVSPKNDAVKERLFNVICSEIADVLAHSFAAPNMCVQGKNGELHIVLFSHDDFDEAVLQFHVNRALTPLLDAAAESLMLIKAGTAHTAEDIERFAAEG